MPACLPVSLTRVVVQALMMRGACLRELNLDGCSGLGDAAVRMLCRACPGLLELSVQRCSAVRLCHPRRCCVAAAIRYMYCGFCDPFVSKHLPALTDPLPSPYPFPSLSLDKTNHAPADLPRSLGMHAASLCGNPGNNANPPAWLCAHPPGERKTNKTSRRAGRQR